MDKGQIENNFAIESIYHSTLTQTLDTEKPRNRNSFKIPEGHPIFPKLLDLLHIFEKIKDRKNYVTLSKLLFHSEYSDLETIFTDLENYLES